MSLVIEDALTTGNFGQLDDIYVRLVEGTQRHTQHGTGLPKPTQACAKLAKGFKQGQRRNTSERTSRTVVRRRGKAKKQRLYVCKRRFPRQRRSMGAIVPDPHNPTIHQVFLERNDCLLNGCEPYEHVGGMSNNDDKGLPPPWATRAPTVVFLEDHIEAPDENLAMAEDG